MTAGDVAGVLLAAGVLWLLSRYLDANTIGIAVFFVAAIIIIIVAWGIDPPENPPTIDH